MKGKAVRAGDLCDFRFLFRFFGFFENFSKLINYNKPKYAHTRKLYPKEEILHKKKCHNSWEKRKIWKFRVKLDRKNSGMIIVFTTRWAHSDEPIFGLKFIPPRPLTIFIKLSFNFDVFGPFELAFFCENSKLKRRKCLETTRGHIFLQIVCVSNFRFFSRTRKCLKWSNIRDKNRKW